MNRKERRTAVINMRQDPLPRSPLSPSSPTKLIELVAEGAHRVNVPMFVNPALVTCFYHDSPITHISIPGAEPLQVKDDNQAVYEQLKAFFL